MVYACFRYYPNVPVGLDNNLKYIADYLNEIDLFKADRDWYLYIEHENLQPFKMRMPRNKGSFDYRQLFPKKAKSRLNYWAYVITRHNPNEDGLSEETFVYPAYIFSPDYVRAAMWVDCYSWLYKIDTTIMNIRPSLLARLKRDDNILNVLQKYRD